jgi:hypothetical protein
VYTKKNIKKKKTKKKTKKNNNKIIILDDTYRTHNKWLISILNKEDKVVDYYQKLQQSPSMQQFKKILQYNMNW